MLFALLFWDILFDSVPGAFETPYQCAPLDLVDDTFYFARQDKIEARLKDIEQGKGPEFVNKHDAAHRERNNLCVGVNWERYGRQELLEIVNVSGPSSFLLIKTHYFVLDEVLQG